MSNRAFFEITPDGKIVINCDVIMRGTLTLGDVTTADAPPITIFPKLKQRKAKK